MYSSKMVEQAGILLRKTARPVFNYKVSINSVYFSYISLFPNVHHAIFKNLFSSFYYRDEFSNKLFARANAGPSNTARAHC